MALANQAVRAVDGEIFHDDLRNASRIRCDAGTGQGGIDPARASAAATTTGHMTAAPASATAGTAAVIAATRTAARCRGEFHSLTVAPEAVAAVTAGHSILATAGGAAATCVDVPVSTVATVTRAPRGTVNVGSVRTVCWRQSR